MIDQDRSARDPTLFEVIDRRRSVRVFARAPIDDRRLRTILEAANAAPSAGNLQAYEIHVVRRDEQLAALAAAAFSQDFLAAAPVVLVFCANPRRNRERYGERGRDLYAVQDATIACAFAMLAATALGLATVWVGAFREDDVRRLVGAPPHERPVALLPIGVAGERPERPPRRPLDRIVHEIQDRPGTEPGRNIRQGVPHVGAAGERVTGGSGRNPG